MPHARNIEMNGDGNGRVNVINNNKHNASNILCFYRKMSLYTGIYCIYKVWDDDVSAHNDRMNYDDTRLT